MARDRLSDFVEATATEFGIPGVASAAHRQARVISPALGCSAECGPDQRLNTMR